MSDRLSIRSPWYFKSLIFVMGLTMALIALGGSIAIAAGLFYFPYWIIHRFSGDTLNGWQLVIYAALLFAEVYILWNVTTFNKRRKAKKYLPIRIQDIGKKEVYDYMLNSLRSKRYYGKYTPLVFDLLFKIENKMIGESDLEEINQLLTPHEFIDEVNSSLMSFIEKAESKTLWWTK